MRAQVKTARLTRSEDLEDYVETESCLRCVIARGVEAELKAKKNEKSNRHRPTTERGRSVPRPRKRSVP